MSGRSHTGAPVRAPANMVIDVQIVLARLGPGVILSHSVYHEVPEFIRVREPQPDRPQHRGLQRQAVDLMKHIAGVAGYRASSVAGDPSRWPETRRTSQSQPLQLKPDDLSPQTSRHGASGHAADRARAPALGRIRKRVLVAVSTTIGENHGGCRPAGESKLPRPRCASSLQPIPGLANTAATG